MSIVCSSHNMDILEDLIVDLEAHSCALDLLVPKFRDKWTDTHIYLLIERVDFLRQTTEDLSNLEQALRQGYEFNAGPPITPEAASDTPSA